MTRRILTVLAMMLMIATSALSYTDIPSGDTGPQLIPDINNRFKGNNSIAPKLDSVTFSNLGTEADGRLKYCSDCTATTPCAASGTGAVAQGVNGGWACAAPGSGGGISPPVGQIGGSTGTPLLRWILGGTITTNTTAAFGTWYECNGTLNLTLPTSSATGEFVGVRNIGLTTCTVLPAGVQTILGSANLSVLPGESYVLQDDFSGNWTVPQPGGMTGVTAGAYTNANVTFDKFGRAISASNGSGGGGSSNQIQSAVADLGFFSSTAATCPNTASFCRITLGGTTFTIDATAPSGIGAQQLTIQLVQAANSKCTANVIPYPCCTGVGTGTCNSGNAGWWNNSAWSNNFKFLGAYGITPILTPGTSENITFLWDNLTSKWQYQSRQFNQAATAQFSVQGGSTGIGNDPGNGGSIAALRMPANQYTSLVGDNGGFFQPEGGGVNFFYNLTHQMFMIYNDYSEPGWVEFICTSNIDGRNVNIPANPILLKPGETHMFPVNSAEGTNSANTVFGTQICGAAPSVPMLNTWHSDYESQVPTN